MVLPTDSPPPTASCSPELPKSQLHRSALPETKTVVVQPTMGLV